MKSYAEHIADRMAAVGDDEYEEDDVVRDEHDAAQAVAEGSVLRAFLESAGDGEMKSAREDLSFYRSASEPEGLARLVADRRGSGWDVLTTTTCAGAAYALGQAAGYFSKSAAVAIAPGALAQIGGLLIKAPYAVRVGLAVAGLSWTLGATKGKSDAG